MDIEKVFYLKNNHYKLWLKAVNSARDTLSETQGLFCICGCLFTGIHEAHCTKFRHKVESMAVKRLSYLFDNDKNI